MLKPSGSFGEVEVFKYVGKLAGQPYDLGLYLKRPVTVSGSLEVKGTFDGSAVRGTIVPNTAGSTNAESVLGTFHGTIGRWNVSGTISASTGTAKRRTAKAIYTVTS